MSDLGLPYILYIYRYGLVQKAKMMVVAFSFIMMVVFFRWVDVVVMHGFGGRAKRQTRRRATEDQEPVDIFWEGSL